MIVSFGVSSVNDLDLESVKRLGPRSETFLGVSRIKSAKGVN